MKQNKNISIKNYSQAIPLAIENNETTKEPSQTFLTSKNGEDKSLISKRMAFLNSQLNPQSKQVFMTNLSIDEKINFFKKRQKEKSLESPQRLYDENKQQEFIQQMIQQQNQRRHNLSLSVGTSVLNKNPNKFNDSKVENGSHTHDDNDNDRVITAENLSPILRNDTRQDYQANNYIVCKKAFEDNIKNISSLSSRIQSSINQSKLSQSRIDSSNPINLSSRDPNSSSISQRKQQLSISSHLLSKSRVDSSFKHRTPMFLHETKNPEQQNSYNNLNQESNILHKH